MAAIIIVLVNKNFPVVFSFFIVWFSSFWEPFEGSRKTYKGPPPLTICDVAKLRSKKLAKNPKKSPFFRARPLIKIGFSRRRRRILENFGYFGAARRYQKAYLGARIISSKYSRKRGGRPPPP